MDETISPTPAPVKVKKPGSRIALLFFITLGVIVLIGSAFFASMLYSPFKRVADEAFVVLRMPPELKRAHFYTSAPTYDGYHISGLQFVRNTTRDTIVLAGTESLDRSRRVLSYTELEDSVPMNVTAHYVGGRKIVPGEWTIAITESNRGLKPVARGFAPAFLDETHIAFFTDIGIAVLDLNSGIEENIYEHPPGSRIDSRIRYSPDRTLVMWTNALTNETMLGRISIHSLELLAVNTKFGNPILTDAALYEARKTLRGLEIWKYDIDGSIERKILTIPPSLSFTSMLI